MTDRGDGLEAAGQSHLWCEMCMSICLKIMLTDSSFFKIIIISGDIKNKKRKLFFQVEERENLNGVHRGKNQVE